MTIRKTGDIARSLISISEGLDARGAAGAKIKIGRNDSCWCGSGVKYKKCHLGRAESKAVSFGQVFQTSIDQNRIRVCSRSGVPGDACGGKLIDAHVISSSRVLRNLADRDGHVLHFNFVKPRPALNLEPSSIGIKRASIFPGFCEKHDNALFSELEKQAFIGSRAQCFLLGYRSVCYELYKKQAAIRSIDKNSLLMDRGHNVMNQLFTQAYMRGNQHAFELGLRDVMHVKERYDRELKDRGAQNFDYCWIRYRGQASVTTALTTQVDFDLDGKKLQNITAGLFSDSPPPPSESLQMAIWAESDHGYVTFSLPQNFNLCADFVRSLWKLPDDQILDAVLEIAFNYSETTFFSSQWWRSLNDNNRTIVKRAAANLHPHVDGMIRGLDGATGWHVDQKYATYVM